MSTNPTSITLIFTSLITFKDAAARLHGSSGDLYHNLEKYARDEGGAFHIDPTSDSEGVNDTVDPRRITSKQCGDGSCDADDSCASSSCPQNQDVPRISFCGDGTCDADETCDSCPFDCTCTSPNCPPEATSCLCPDRTTSCSVDQDCPSTTTSSAGTCSGGFRAGLPCTKSVYCSTEDGDTAECLGVETVTTPPEEGSCRSCAGVQQHSGLIIGDINQCDEGDLCGDFTNNTNPVTCVSCLTPMTCEDWCKIDSNLGRYDGNFLESHRAKTSCPGGGFDYCSCSIASFFSNSWTTASNKHDGAICNAHNFGACGDGRDWCVADFPGHSYCESLGTVSITGTLDSSGVCTCHATVGSTTKDVWSSECIENIQLYHHGPDGNGNGTLPALALPCSFTG